MLYTFLLDLFLCVFLRHYVCLSGQKKNFLFSFFLFVYVCYILLFSFLMVPVICKTATQTVTVRHSNLSVFFFFFLFSFVCVCVFRSSGGGVYSDENVVFRVDSGRRNRAIKHIY